jgi:hypothetical protein
MTLLLFPAPPDFSPIQNPWLGQHVLFQLCNLLPEDDLLFGGAEVDDLLGADLLVLAECADAAFDVQDMADVDGRVDDGERVRVRVGRCVSCRTRTGRSRRWAGRNFDDAFEGCAAAIVNRVEVLLLALVDGDYDARNADPFDRVIEVEVDILAYGRVG